MATKRKRKTRRPRGGGSVWEYRPGVFLARLPGRGAASKGGFASEADAWQWVRANVHKPQSADTLGGWLDHWLRVQKANVEPSTYRRDRQVIDYHVRPHLGAVRLRDLTAVRINGWLAKLHADGVGSDSRARAWVTLRKVLRAHESFDRSALGHVKPPRHRRREAKFLDADQYRVLVATADSWVDEKPYLPALVRVGVECCCRPNELLGLRVGDYRDGVISVRQALCSVTNKPKSLKTVGSRRDVPLSPAARAAVDGWLAVRGTPGVRQGYAGVPLFPSATGRWMWYTHYRDKVWGPLRQAAGIPEHGAYCLRHTGASLLVSSGRSLRAIAARMGHADPSMVLKVYAHCMKNDQDSLTEVFAGLGE